MSAHVAAETLGRIAAGSLPGAADAEHLCGCARCRAELAERDPSAIFGLLGVLDTTVPAYPGLPAGAARRPGLRERTAHAGLTAAIAILAFLSLFAALRTPARRGETVAAVADIAPRTGNSTAIVSGVNSPTAKIMTLVPAGGEGPSVTLIIDEEFDL